jgi:hypothetical protein
MGFFYQQNNRHNDQNNPYDPNQQLALHADRPKGGRHLRAFFVFGAKFFLRLD